MPSLCAEHIKTFLLTGSVKMKKSVLDIITLTVAPLLASLFIRLIYLTMREKTFLGFEPYRALLDSGGQVILAFWHGRLLMVTQVYPRKGLTALISLSKDGELIARTMGRLGVRSVRGSTSRGSLGGVKGLLKAAHEGADLVITPDGPRGPGMKAQMGIIQIASRTGLPIIPLSFCAEKKKVFKSWDSFQLPRLFTRGVFVCSEPQYIAPRAGPEQMEAARARLERALKEATERADNFFKKS